MIISFVSVSVAGEHDKLEENILFENNQAKVYLCYSDNRYACHYFKTNRIYNFKF